MYAHNSYYENISTPVLCNANRFGGTAKPNNVDAATCNNVAIGGTCTVGCAQGWTLQGNLVTYKCESGALLHPLTASVLWPTCAPNTCSTTQLPTDEMHDTSLCNGKKTGETCSVHCATGHDGTPSTFTCGTAGIFVGSEPVCTPKNCRVNGITLFSTALPTPDNQDVDAVYDKSTCEVSLHYNQHCTVSCRNGAGSKTYVCGSDGRLNCPTGPPPCAPGAPTPAPTPKPTPEPTPDPGGVFYAPPPNASVAAVPSPIPSPNATDASTA